MARRPNGRRVKIHRNYTIAEAAAFLGVHKHTVSRWIAAGLPTTDAKRPFLIRGQDLRAFLRAREPDQTEHVGRASSIACAVGRPDGPRWRHGRLQSRTPPRAACCCGICPTCDTMIYRAVSLGTIEQKRGGLDIAFPSAERRIGDIVLTPLQC